MRISFCQAHVCFRYRLMLRTWEAACAAASLRSRVCDSVTIGSGGLCSAFLGCCWTNEGHGTERERDGDRDREGYDAPQGVPLDR